MSQAPCIEYKSSFVKSELETVKLKQDYEDGSYKQYKAPVFNGEGTVECFFYIEERFRHYATKLDWTTGPEMFENFEEILSDTALEKWETRTQEIAIEDYTMELFEQTIQEYLLEFVDPLAKDYMIKYLKSFHRPVHTKPREHATRMETLIRYTNRLPGTEPNITAQQTKNIICESFPLTWRQSWIRSGKSLVNNTLAELVQFMANEQTFADEKDKTNKKKDGNGNNNKDFHRNNRDRNNQGRGRNGNNRGRGRGRGNYDRSNKFPRNGPSPDEDCPIHGGHPWRKCNQNSRGDNYNPARGGRGNDQGRGGNAGRGNYGRNNGRGGRNTNYTNNNSTNNASEHHHMDGPSQQNNNSGNNNGQGANSNNQQNAEHHHLDMIGNPQPAGQGKMPGWRG